MGLLALGLESLDRLVVRLQDEESTLDAVDDDVATLKIRIAAP